MSAERALFLDSSAIVKLIVEEPESSALRRYLRRKSLLVCSALAHTEVRRAVLPSGEVAVARAGEVLRRLDTIRISNHILRNAGTLPPDDLRSLDAIHLASAAELGHDLSRVCTYDGRMASAAKALGMVTVAPS